MKSKKLVISSKNALELKYGTGFRSIQKKLNDLIKADKKLGFETTVVYIDDSTSARKAGITAVKSVTPQSCKQAIDRLYKKHIPAYIVLLGAQDVIPFVEINNPASDDDKVIPSDLPYACEKPYSKNINDFTGPTRVVGRLPDIAGGHDPAYLTGLITHIIKAKPRSSSDYMKYFAVSCDVWKQSTRLSLQHMFGNYSQLLLSPPAGKKYTAAQLRALTHFFNCHGASNDFYYYGQKGRSYPEALHTSQLENKVSYGTIVAAECCYGAELVDNTRLGISDQIAIANQYLLQGALAFMGSSTIAYGPVDSQGLADLITQYFIKFILEGASTGRALLEARQKFLAESGPSLDPYELKTLAQFHLMGDPSVLPVIPPADLKRGAVKENTIHNNRINLYNKGVQLESTIAESKKQPAYVPSKNKSEINKLLKQTHFTDADKKLLYTVEPSKYKAKATARSGKTLVNTRTKFRTFIKEASRPEDKIKKINVLVVKETDEDVLGWRIYVSR